MVRLPDSAAAPPAPAQELHLSTPAHTRYLSLYRQTVTEACRGAGHAGTFIQTVVSAVSEGCNNAIEHAYAFDDRGRLDLHLRVDRHGVEAELCYEDRDFEPDAIPEAELGGMQEGGYGVFLMRQLMDHVEYGKEGGGRIRLRLRKSVEGRTP